MYIYMPAHIYIHTLMQNVHINARKARLKRRCGIDCAGGSSWPEEALPFSLSAAIWRGIPFVASTPVARPRGTTDKRRTTTINSSSLHHHDSAPSRPHPLICTGAEPIHPVHGPPKLRAWPWPPETRSFSCHFGGLYVRISWLLLGWDPKHPCQWAFIVWVRESAMVCANLCCHGVCNNFFIDSASCASNTLESQKRYGNLRFLERCNEEEILFHRYCSHLLGVFDDRALLM